VWEGVPDGPSPPSVHSLRVSLDPLPCCMPVGYWAHPNWQRRLVCACVCVCVCL